MKKTLLFTALSFAMLSGCNAGGNKASEGLSLAPVDEKDIVATVNGRPISRQELDYIKAEITRGNPHAKINIPEDKLVEELVNRELLRQEAVQKQLPRQPDVATRIRYTERAVLSQAGAQEYLKQHPVTEEQIKAEYDRLVGAMKQQEFKARHILVKSKEEAEEIIKQLDQGKDFAELAKQYSIGPSAKNGGDLGWFVPQRMVKPFADAVVALKDGEYTKEPVQTRFGWHVILREQSRAKTPPPYEQVKPQIEQMLKRKLIQQHIQELKQKADIQLKTAAQEAAPAPQPAETATP
ncbi:peptidyl-prolyl cis-trans isomerase C [Methylomarinovum caldicuralii]|uniref:peptidylprolyl isomerase n=1 Tax=Methylomarinovum caldicuralii TaxID=438856 RepID=A0AAU9CHY8_9GAMM|nr:peptidylprolyl isomerase [Methylomarinovum caldicuralii]BCX81211.1 peptidyl-prolyl cis-trans isomerase C [Methylomarinovum caldicuralii]